MSAAPSHPHDQPIEPSAMTSTALSKADRIRLLNDRLRQTFLTGRVVITAGVRALDEEARANLFRVVRAFDAFTPDNDPYGEHDFGRVVVGDEGYFWKIDYYDSDLQYMSPEPSDEAVTTRVLTIMREDEY